MSSLNVAPTKAGEISTAAEDVNQVAGMIQGKITDLYNRLGTILSPAGTDAEGREETPCLTELGADLIRAKKSLHASNDRLADLLQRIQI